MTNYPNIIPPFAYHGGPLVPRCARPVIPRLGELCALRVEDPGIFRFILSMMQAPSYSGAPASQMAQALDSLYAIPYGIFAG
jgi:hypothetical protein